MRNAGLTPNMVTYMSTSLTFLALYYLYVGNEIYACVSYFFGYIFDCVDGKMARKYNMGSKYGMALDLVSDNLSHFILIGYYDNAKVQIPFSGVNQSIAIGTNALAGTSSNSSTIAIGYSIGTGIQSGGFGSLAQDSYAIAIGAYASCMAQSAI
jgi:phosphatidylglycerophosphate synthase